jgi:hypothetical protein
MKRLFNAYLLLMKIYKGELGNKKDEKENVRDKRILFAILCMQQAFEELYDYLMMNIADLLEGNLLLEMTKTDAYIQDENGEEQGIAMEKSRVAKATAFMSAFILAIDEDNDKVLSDKECESFINILKKSKVTSSGTSEYQNASPDVVAFRAYNRSIVTEINKHFSDVVKTFPGAETFKVFMVKTERKGWNYQDCCGYVDMLQGYHVDYKIHTDVNESPFKAEVIVFAGPKYGKDKSFFESTIQDKILALEGFEKGTTDLPVYKRIPYGGDVALTAEYQQGIKAIVVPEILRVLEALKK